MSGVHTVKEVMPPNEAQQHTFLRLTLGSPYGKRVAGEVVSVAAWQCRGIPVDPEDAPS